MKIIVCMKQVPAGTKVDIDPETGAMKRLSGDTRTNPYDLFALETALQLREKLGGTVTVLTMGPPQTEEMMRQSRLVSPDGTETAGAAYIAPERSPLKAALQSVIRILIRPFRFVL